MKQLKPGFALMLRTCDKDLKSYGGFQWPQKGLVTAPDWKPTPECGNGLHGLLWGEGNGSLLNWKSDAAWLAVLVKESSVVQIAGKIKVSRGYVVRCGDRKSVTDFIAANGGQGKAICGYQATAGYSGTATAGYGGIIKIRWYDGMRSRIAIGYVGENGIEPNVPYVVKDGKLWKK